MNSLRWIAALATVTLSLPVLATPTPVTTAYDFNAGTSSGTTQTGGTVYSSFGDAASQNGLYNGGYFGNSATYLSGGISTTVTAWASTGSGSTTPTGAGSGVNTTQPTNTATNFTNGTIQNAVLTQYSTSNGGTGPYSGTGNAFGETSRNTNGGYGNHDFTCNGSSCTPDVPQHAVDNEGAYETLLFSFSTSVTLSSVTLGYPGVDSSQSNNDGTSDLTYLYCTAKGVTDNACVSSSFAGKTYSQLVSSGDWAYGNLLNLSSTNDTGSTGQNAKSQYWMIGAFIADLPNQIVGDNTPDYVKIRALTVCTSSFCAVPEPSSIALFGIAGGALWLGRRRRTLRVA